jgi:hypothetical protein
VAIRTCPQCMARVPAGAVVAYSDGMECPGCRAQLEVSLGSRVLATSLGLVFAALVWRTTRWSGGSLGWVLPLVYSFLTFSVVAPVFLMLTADLVGRRAEPPPAMGEAAPASSAHGPEGAHH